MSLISCLNCPSFNSAPARAEGLNPWSASRWAASERSANQKTDKHGELQLTWQGLHSAGEGCAQGMAANEEELRGIVLPLLLFQHGKIFPSRKQPVTDISSTRTDFCRRAGLPPYTTPSGGGAEGLENIICKLCFFPRSSWFSISRLPKASVSRWKDLPVPPALFLTPQPNTCAWLSD